MYKTALIPMAAIHPITKPRFDLLLAGDQVSKQVTPGANTKSR